MEMTDASLVLLFNLPADERTKAIEAYLTERQIGVRHVQSVEYRQKLGYLLQLPGYTDSGCHFGASFSDEMAVMVGFDAQQLNAFLDFFRQAGLRRIEYKAMLTPTNVSWDVLTLHRHLRSERDALEAAKRKKR
jgi:hypothetical protein